MDKIIKLWFQSTFGGYSYWDFEIVSEVGNLKKTDILRKWMTEQEAIHLSLLTGKHCSYSKNQKHEN